MDFKKILKMQRELDNAYASEGLVHSTNNIDIKRVIAILVEIGEFANEYAPFKYWKRKKNLNMELVREEFVDGIHFFSTFINNFNIEQTIFEPIINSEDKSTQLLHTFKAVSDFGADMSVVKLLHAFRLYLGNAVLIGITFEEVEKAYIMKNKVNFERIKNGY